MTSSAQIRSDSQRFFQSVKITLIFIGILWLIRLIEYLTGIDISPFGITPGEPRGLVGIIYAPLIHGSWSHLIANTSPLLILGTLMLYGYREASKIAFPVIYIGTGICVWLFANRGIHFGASGLAHGMMFFVFVAGILRWNKRDIALSIIVFFLYGGMIWSIFPNDPTISYESHFFGAMFGVILAFVLKNRDPEPPVKHYDWEDQDEEDDPVIGDQWRK